MLIAGRTDRQTGRLVLVATAGVARKLIRINRIYWTFSLNAGWSEVGRRRTGRPEAACTYVRAAIASKLRPIVAARP